eukprot:COSAG06_NODE_759_length_12508_cov_9.809171_3_plen_332_part_00
MAASGTTSSTAGVAALTRRIATARAQEAELQRQVEGHAADAARMEATLTFWSGGGNLLTGVAEDALLLRIASFLLSAKDLLALGLTCGRFAIMCIAPPPPAVVASGNSAAAVEQQQPAMERWSIVQEAARRWLMQCTDQERGWVPRRGRESWLGLMWEVEVLRRSAVFGRSHELITLSEGGSVATKGEVGDQQRAAASKAVMRAGCHYAQFTVVSSQAGSMFFGVIRPGWDVEGGQYAEYVDGHCFYDTYYGERYPGSRHWEGMEGAMQDGERIGLLLDLDLGTMTVYKNDERLGVMATGLSGGYSWAVSLWEQGDSAHIEAASVPAPPTE